MLYLSASQWAVVTGLSSSGAEMLWEGALQLHYIVQHNRLSRTIKQLAKEQISPVLNML